MNIKSFVGGKVCVELSRRNLQILLAKLDGFPLTSLCSLSRQCENGLILEVNAVENDAAYPDRKPGEMHPDTEAQLQNV